MQRFLIIILICFLFFAPGPASSQNVYNNNLKIDIPIAVLSTSLTGIGFYLRNTKPGCDTAQINKLDPFKFKGYNYQVTCNYSYKASIASDVLFIAGFAAPLFLYFDKHADPSWQLLAYQTFAITGMGYGLSAGLVDKYRPYAYNSEIIMKRRASRKVRNSFYAGHPAVTAAGMFFLAKTYSDYHPNSDLRYAFWGGAALSSAACGYFRYRGGFHFPSDIIIGTLAGTLTGILVPHFHKRTEK